ncbi:MAG TPA: PH domain-containing protein [Mycobacteriales bacterium]|nr:PH domain-containing protein [Mycobacteriales bacterium]
MAWPQRVLGEDEDVVLHLHPHGSALLRPALVLIVTAGATGFLLAKADLAESGDSGLGSFWATALVLTVAATVLLAWTLRPFLRWRATHLVLTTRRLIVRRGVLKRSGRDLLLARVDDVGFSRTARQRLVGSGTLLVQSESGYLSVADVPRVEQVQTAILDQAEISDPGISPG